jgi:hypothetical protein
MKRKTEIPVNKPIKYLVEKAQKPQKQNNTRGDIIKKTTDNYNPNSGPKQRSRKKSF